MKKKLIIILGVCLALMFSLAACGGSYSRKPVSGGPAASDPVTNNGSMVVTKGDYYYYINGKADQSADNSYDKVVKGAIVRTKKADLNDASKHDIIVPKIALNSYAETGFYIFGDYIYFTSPNADKDKDGSVQYTYLDFMRAKLDGSSAERLLIKSSASIAHRYFERDGKVILAYIDNSKVHVLDCATKEDIELVTEYTGTPIFTDDGKVLYTANVYYDLVSGEEKENIDQEEYSENQDKYGIQKYNKVLSTDVFTKKHAVIKKDSDTAKSQFTYTLLNREVSLGTEYIYYTKSEIAGGTSNKGTYRALAKSFAIDGAVQISTGTSVGTILTAPNGNGYLTQGSTAIMWYSRTFDENGKILTNYEKPLLKLTGATLFNIRQNGDQYYLYYFNSSALERIDLPGASISDSNVVEEEDANKMIVLGKSSLDTMGTDWIKPVYMDGKWFFFNSGADAFEVTAADEDEKDEDVIDAAKNKHVTMFKRSGYLFTAVEAEGEDYEDKIVPAVRVGKLSTADQETEDKQLEAENETRDVNAFDYRSKKVFKDITKISALTKEEITQEMKDLVARYNTFDEDFQKRCSYKDKILLLEKQIKKLGA